MAPVLEARAAVRRFGGAIAVGPVDLAIEEGSTTALIGPSGAGKSTLLRLFNGLLSPGAGEVRFRGASLRDADLPRIRRQIGYVVQGGGLFPHLDAESNVALVARWLRWEPRRVDARIEELASIVRLPRDALRRFPSQLSGGQAQRVSLMRALMLAIVVGSKQFTESVLLGEIATQALQSADIAASHRRELGGTRILWEALRAGQIDVYPEYTGTLSQELLPGETDLPAALARLGRRV